MIKRHNNQSKEYFFIMPRYVIMNHEFKNLEELARRNNPNYTQIAGLIDKDLARRLRVYCADQGVTIAEVMEEAIGDFLEKKRSKQDTLGTSANNSSTKGEQEKEE
jgi:hypothetical protein